MKEFVEIEKGVYLEASSIKVIIDYSKKNAKFQALVSRCKKNDKARNEEIEKRKNLAEKGYIDDSPIPYRKRYFAHSSKTEDNTYRFVITRNNELHSTSLSYDELRQECANSGINLIDMSDYACVNLAYIAGIDNVSDETVSPSRRYFNAEVAILQFVSGVTSKTNTVLWLKTNEIIKLSKDTQEILAQAEGYQDK